MRRPKSLQRMAYLILAFLTACSDEPSAVSQDAVTHTDSAGVVVVSNSRAFGSPDAPNRRLSDSPLLRIGSIDNPLTSFSRIRAIDVSADGTLLIGDHGGPDIRAFSANGDFLWRAGREGEGPGEFRGIHDLEVCGERIVVVDLFVRRLTFLTLDGSLDTTHPYNSSAEAATPASFDCNARGDFARLDRGVGGEVPSGTTYVTDAVISLGALESMQEVAQHRMDGFARFRHSTTDGPAEYGLSTYIALGDSLLHIAASDQPSIRSYDARGELARITRWDMDPVPLTSELLNEDLERRLSRFPSSMQARYRDVWEQMDFPAQMPTVDQMIQSRDGELWVRRFVPLGDETRRRWWIFDSQGALHASVETPSSLEILAVTQDRVFGVATDDLDVEYVEVYAIEPADSGAAR